MGPRSMLTSEAYKQSAERCAELASECSAPAVAEALGALALDYGACGESAQARNNSDIAGSVDQRGVILPLRPAKFDPLILLAQAVTRARAAPPLRPVPCLDRQCGCARS
jgi:hypothetical protein